MSNLSAAKQAIQAGQSTVAATNPVNTVNAGYIYVNPKQTAMDRIKHSIKRERQLKGWTQRDLARESKYSQGTITRAEKHGWISINALISIAEALGKHIDLTN